MKIRGYGVDLVEVERVLVGVDGVAEGAVKVWARKGAKRSQPEQVPWFWK